MSAGLAREVEHAVNPTVSTRASLPLHGVDLVSQVDARLHHVLRKPAMHANHLPPTGNLFTRFHNLVIFLRLITCLVGNEGTRWHVIKNITSRERPERWKRNIQDLNEI